MSPSNRNRDRLLNGPVTPVLLRFALPLLVTNMMASISATWAAIWVSHMIGPAALTAVANVNIFLGMMTGAANGIATAAGIAVGQAAGANSPETMRRIAGNAVTLAALCGTLLAALGYVQAAPIAAFIHMPLAAFGYGTVFLSLSSLGMPAAFVLVFMLMMLRATGDARTPFAFTIVAIAVNLVLTPVLIDGWFGMPRLGVSGAALAGICANVIACAGIILYTYVRRLPLALHGAGLRYLLPDPRMFWLLIRRGMPVAAESQVVLGAYFVLIKMVNSHGADTAAAYSGAASLWSYVQMPSVAMAGAMSAMAAMNIGAGAWTRVGQIAVRGVMLGILLTAGITFAVYAAGDLPLRLFLPQGGAPLDIARQINHVVLWGWIVLAVTSGLSAIVRANAAMLAPTLIYLITMWILRIPFASLLQPDWGAAAIWWSFPFGSISSALLAFLYYRFGGWRRNRPLVSQMGETRLAAEHHLEA